MADITYKYDSIFANVKSYRGYNDFIHSIHVKVSATDGTHNFSFERDYELNIDREFTEETPFIPFDQWDLNKVMQLVEELVVATKTKEYLARQIMIAAAQPTPKSFNF